MERVGILINKLQEQLSQKSSISNMLVTAQLLQTELLLQNKQINSLESKKVAVMMPHTLYSNAGEFLAEPDICVAYKPIEKPEPEPQPVAPPVSEPETPLAAPMPIPKPEPEPIPHFVEEKAWQRLFVDKEEANSPWHIDPMTEIPTFAHQEKVVFELNDLMFAESGVSLNEKLKQESDEVATILHDIPVKDLKKAISINDRHQFIQDLFRGDETMYERSIKTINGFHIFAEAEYWIQRELKVKLGWDTSLELVKIFDQVVKRRFA